MFLQVKSVPLHIQSQSRFNKHLTTVRHMQPPLALELPESSPLSWTPFTAGPYFVPVTRWIE